VLPGGFEITRGEEVRLISEGMICAVDELGIGRITPASWSCA